MAAITSFLVGAYSAFSSYSAGKKAQKEQQKQTAIMQQQAEEQKKQAELARRRQQLIDARNMRASLRQSRLAQGAMANAAANQGAMGGSGFLGGYGSLGTQTASNVAFAGQQTAIGNQLYNSQSTIAGLQGELGASQGRQAAYGAQASMWGTIGNYAGQTFKDAGGFNTVFKKTGLA